MEEAERSKTGTQSSLNREQNLLNTGESMATATEIVNTKQSTDLVTRGPDSMLTIIERAVMSPDFDVNKLQQLLELRERWERNEARKAFVVAMNEFKADPPRIHKNKHVHFDTQKGPTDYDHATLDHVCDVVTTGLSSHGITHRWKVEQSPEGIKVTCILTHELGHSEETTLMGAPDTTGSKNSIQAISSTVTYLERYTLLAATGLAAANTDTDGNLPTNGALSEKIEWLQNAKDKDELRRLFTAAYREFESNSNAIRALTTAKDAKLKEWK